MFASLLTLGFLLFGCTTSPNGIENVNLSMSKFQNCSSGASIQLTTQDTIFFQGFSGDTCLLKTNYGDTCGYTKQELQNITLTYPNVNNAYGAMAGTLAPRCKFVSTK
jgi:hypothetical protein